MGAPFKPGVGLLRFAQPRTRASGATREFGLSNPCRACCYCGDSQALVADQIKNTAGSTVEERRFSAASRREKNHGLQPLRNLGAPFKPGLGLLPCGQPRTRASGATTRTGLPNPCRARCYGGDSQALSPTKSRTRLAAPWKSGASAPRRGEKKITGFSPCEIWVPHSSPVLA
jgi:hypothetical protein